jgi:cell division septal protein FtsQ
LLVYAQLTFRSTECFGCVVVELLLQISNFSGKERGKLAVIIDKKPRKQNRRTLTSRQRRQQHLLDVRVRTRKAAARRTQQVFFLFSVLLILGSTVAGIAFGAKRALNAWFFQNPDYAIRSIDVTTDGKLTRETILKTAGVVESANIFEVNLLQVQERLRALPQVEESRVQRVLPNKLVINIQERRPVAWVVASDSLPETFEDAFLVDRRGILLKPKASAPEYAGLPVILGVETSSLVAGQALDKEEVKAALELLRDAAEILQTRLQIQSIDVSKDYCLVVTDKQRSVITFGTEDLVLQLRRLERLMDYCEKNSRELQTANLLVQRNIPVTFMSPPSLEVEAAPSPEPIKPAVEAPTPPAKTSKRNHGGKRPQPKKTPMEGKL